MSPGTLIVVVVEHQVLFGIKNHGIHCISVDFPRKQSCLLPRILNFGPAARSVSPKSAASPAAGPPKPVFHFEQILVSKIKKVRPRLWVAGLQRVCAGPPDFDGLATACYADCRLRLKETVFLIAII